MGTSTLALNPAGTEAAAALTANVPEADATQAGLLPQSNFVAVVVPTVNDDVGSGYAVGSKWLNTLTNIIYECADATGGAAVWVEVQEEYSVGAIPSNQLTTGGDPTAADVTVIGADTYEFLSAAGTISNDAYVGVLRGVSEADTLTNFAAAINGAGTGIADGLLAVGGGGPIVVENGTENLFATATATTIDLQPADVPGGVLVASSPNIAVTAVGLTVATEFDYLNMNLGGGAAPARKMIARTSVTITAEMVTNDHVSLSFPGITTIQGWMLQGVDSGDDTLVMDTMEVVIATNTLTFVPTSATVAVATDDIIHITVWGI